MLEPAALRIHGFGDDPLGELAKGSSKQYLRRYLADLGAKVVIEEPHYFDRDYLAEYAAFYCASARGYGNRCRRLHFFSDASIDRSALERAAGNDDDALTALTTMRASYLGFAVVRPFHPPRLGRTVLRWYPDKPPLGFGDRVTASRKYLVHLAGISLEIDGLAWQQQDAGVGTCSTVALWSMLQSSAFDDHHAIPTTAGITQAAARYGTFGTRVFPSPGLSVQQLGEAIQAHGLSPIFVQSERSQGFSRERLANNLTAFIRSGYPVVVAGRLVERDPTIGGLHAVCATGFRSAPALDAKLGEVAFADGNTPCVYLHDDNLGPNVKFEIEEVSVPGKNSGEQIRVARLVARDPQRTVNPGVHDSPQQHLIPTTLLVAVHNELRTSPDALYKVGRSLSTKLSNAIDHALKGGSEPVVAALQFSSRFIGVREYMREELPRMLANNSKALSRVRLALVESVPPMSLHIGLVRIGLGAQPLVDFIFDTTDSDLGLRAFAHVALVPEIADLVKSLSATGTDVGIPVDGV